MEFLKRNLTQIQAQLGGMSFASRWLITSLMVILLLVGGMLVYWGGSADMVPIDGMTAGSMAESVTALRADGIEAQVSGGELKVPKDQSHQAVASLSRAGHLSPNASLAFDRILDDDNSSLMLTSTEKNRKYLLAKGNFLSAVIGSFPNVESASVIIDKPEANGFGVSHIEPSASVMVQMRAGYKVSQPMADTLIHMVSSAVAGLDQAQVTVSDVINSRSFSAASEDQIDSLANLDATLTSERMHKNKIEEVLRSWDGIMVAVKIVTSHVLREEVKANTWDKPAITLSESESKVSKNTTNGGEPGPSTNLGTSIAGSGGSGNETSEERTTEQFGTPLPTRQSVQRIAGNTIRKINVSVVVPRSYYVRVYKAQNPEAKDPSDAELQPIVDAEEAKIRSLVGLQTVASDEEMQPGDISVAMVYDKAYLEPAVARVGSGLGAVMSSDATKTGMLAGLVVLSFGLMFYMVRRATRREDLPSVEELAGIPPKLPTDDDLIGEVDEMDGSLAGVELDEGELRARQIADQISDLVRANPQEAGGLLTKWIVDDLT